MKLQLNQFVAEVEFMKDDGKLRKLSNEIIQAKKKLEEELIMKVLEDILKREPTIDDAKKCTKKRLTNDSLNYVFGYNGIDLGTVTFENSILYEAKLERREKHMIRFKPLQYDVMWLNEDVVL